MTVLLLICSVNLVQSQTVSSKPIASSTGEILKTDTSKVIIPISFLRDANAKLIERLYLIKIIAQKDSIINLNRSYIKKQGNIIREFQDKVINLTDKNNKLVVNLNKSKNTNKTLKYIIGALSISLGGVLLIK